MRASKALRTILILVLAIGWTLADAARAAEPNPSLEAAAFIKTLGNQVVAIQDSESASGAKALRDLIRQGFDLNRTSQLVLGRFWSQATEQQRAEFKDLFAEYLLNTYARHLDAYRVDTLELIAVKRIKRDDFLVQTRLEREGEVADAIWRVRALGSEHRIIDIFIDGISLTLTHRSEFASVIGQKGFDGMLAFLRERVSRRTRSLERTVPTGLAARILFSSKVDDKVNLLLRER